MPQPTRLSAPRTIVGTHGNLPAIANQACTEAIPVPGDGRRVVGT